MIRGVPPGSVCYEDQSSFNETKCEHVLASWFNSTFHAKDPISVGYPQWADNPCPPIYPNGTSVTGDPGAGERGCSLGGYPVYALNATQTQHIQAVVKFAKEKRIRLNVKSTGHSFTGRSTGYGSLRCVFVSKFHLLKLTLAVYGHTTCKAWNSKRPFSHNHVQGIIRRWLSGLPQAIESEMYMKLQTTMARS